MVLYSVSVFSGIGAISIGVPLLYVEKDYYCKKVLRARFADGSLKEAPICDDILKLKHLPTGCQLLYGGFPCQDISCIGRQRGIIEGGCSTLFFEMTRLASDGRPKYLFFENVSGIRLLEKSWKLILQTLYQIGYDCNWVSLSASDAGAPHLRNRWFMLCTLQRTPTDEIPNLNGKKMHSCGQLISGYYFPTPEVLGNPAKLSIKLLPLSGKKSCRSSNLVTRQIIRKRWATCRASGGNHPARALTKRGISDLATQLRFAEDTPEEIRFLPHCRPNAEWVESNLMGLPVGWTNHKLSLPSLWHTFVEDRSIPRLVSSNISNSHRLKMLGNSCCVPQFNMAFKELWKRVHVLSTPPLPQLLEFPPLHLSCQTTQNQSWLNQ